MGIRGHTAFGPSRPVQWFFYAFRGRIWDFGVPEKQYVNMGTLLAHFGVRPITPYDLASLCTCTAVRFTQALPAT